MALPTVRGGGPISLEGAGAVWSTALGCLVEPGSLPGFKEGENRFDGAEGFTLFGPSVKPESRPIRQER